MEEQRKNDEKLNEAQEPLRTEFNQLERAAPAARGGDQDRHADAAARPGRLVVRPLPQQPLRADGIRLRRGRAGKTFS